MGWHGTRTHLHGTTRTRTHSKVGWNHVLHRPGHHVLTRYTHHRHVHHWASIGHHTVHVHHAWHVGKRHRVGKHVCSRIIIVIIITVVTWFFPLLLFIFWTTTCLIAHFFGMRLQVFYRNPFHSIYLNFHIRAALYGVVHSSYGLLVYLHAMDGQARSSEQLFMAYMAFEVLGLLMLNKNFFIIKDAVTIPAPRL